VSPPSDPDAATRLDLTHLAVFTIDDASTKDVDDGISVERDEDGQLLLWVHVADPTAWLQPGRVWGVIAAGLRTGGWLTAAATALGGLARCCRTRQGRHQQPQPQP